MLKKNKIKLKKLSYRNVQRKLTDKIIEKEEIIKATKYELKHLLWVVKLNTKSQTWITVNLIT